MAFLASCAHDGARNVCDFEEQLLDQLHAAFHRPNTTIYRWTQGVVWFLILISIGILTLEVVADAPFARRPEVLLADRVILWIFVGEMGLRVLSFRPPDLNFYQGNSLWRIRINLTGRVGYLFQPLTIVDLLAILALDPTLRGLRALRLLRLLRILPFFRYSSPFLGIARVFQENALLYLATLGALLSLATIGGLSLYHVESQANPLVTNAWDGIWWALVTLTTVGYGDITPATTLGRIIGGFLMVGGMFMIAVFAGTVSSTLLNIVLSIREDQFRMSGFTDHIVVCGYRSGSDLMLTALLDEVDTNTTDLLVFAPGDRPPELPVAYHFVSGDPTREAELAKARLAFARAVVIVADRTCSPQQADASTILSLFTIKSYMEKNPLSKERQEPIHLVAEVLDPENVSHATAAGAEEVIETHRLGFAMMAHAVTVPGSGEVLGRVAGVGQHSLYIGKSPLPLPASFGEIAREMKQRHGVTVLGLHDHVADEAVLNPKDDLQVEERFGIVYLARSAVIEEF